MVGVREVTAIKNAWPATVEEQEYGTVRATNRWNEPQLKKIKTTEFTKTLIRKPLRRAMGVSLSVFVVSLVVLLIAVLAVGRFASFLMGLGLSLSFVAWAYVFYSLRRLKIDIVRRRTAFLVAFILVGLAVVAFVAGVEFSW